MQLSFAFFYDNEFEEFCAINKISQTKVFKKSSKTPFHKSAELLIIEIQIVKKKKKNE